MAACGTPQETMRQSVINGTRGTPIDLKTLRKAFRYELDQGMEISNAIVAQSLFKKATGSGPQSVTAAIFWLKTRARWRETSDGDAMTNDELAANVQEAIQQALATVEGE
jgi:hypothetical protein